MDYYAVFAAIRNGHASVVQFLCENSKISLKPGWLKTCTHTRHLQVVEFILKNPNFVQNFTEMKMKKLESQLEQIQKSLSLIPKRRIHAPIISNQSTENRVIPIEEIAFFRVFTDQKLLRMITKYHCTKAYIAIRKNRLEVLHSCENQLEFSQNFRREWYSAMKSSNIPACNWHVTEKGEVLSSSCHHDNP